MVVCLSNPMPLGFTNIQTAIFFFFCSFPCHTSNFTPPSHRVTSSILHTSPPPSTLLLLQNPPPSTPHPPISHIPSMKLNVCVLEASGLPVSSRESNFVYAKVRVRKHKGRTKAVRVSDPVVWNEEFVFRVDDEDEEVSVGVYFEEEHGLFGGDEMVGKVKFPVFMVLEEERQTLLPTWFPLQCKRGGRGRRKVVDDNSGRILLTMTLHGGKNRNYDRFTIPSRRILANDLSELGKMPGSPNSNEIPTVNADKLATTSEEKQVDQSIAAHYVQKLLNRKEKMPSKLWKGYDTSELSDVSSGTESSKDESTFEQAIETLQLTDQIETPENLHEGVLVEKAYMVTPKVLNMLLFEPNSKFKLDLVTLQGTKDYTEGPWMWRCEGVPCLKRTVSYVKAATKMIKSVKAVEDQVYLKADGREFAVLITVGTPDVPYGNCFLIDLLYKIMPGPQLSSGQDSSLLNISWRINFIQSTVMRSVIEASARQGLKDNFEQFIDLLGQSVKAVDTHELVPNKEMLLANLQQEHQSDWEFAVDYFWNFTVFSTILMLLYVFSHILVSGPGTIKGLEFEGLDLPDTFSELFTSAVLVLQGERVFNMISRFVQARLQKGSDHGIKAQGDGWVLTVALVEGTNLPTTASCGIPNPFVVFTCNGQSRVSSVKLQTLDPHWNDILEFDAMQKPPSVLDVEVYYFDAPLDITPSIGHAEVNFLKHTSEELSDIWISLEGKLAQASHSKLHLKIFLENTKGSKIVEEYLDSMEKKVGKKLNAHSRQRNSTFQRLFGLPPEEFLIDDFSCYLKRKIPLQGRLFVSARIVGFYSNILGYKTKFCFLWEDIEDIQTVSPSLATAGSLTLLFILQKGRGFDAGFNTKSIDEEGRLRVQFQSFASFDCVHRTIMTLWRSRTISPGKNVDVSDVEDEQGT